MNKIYTNLILRTGNRGLIVLFFSMFLCTGLLQAQIATKYTFKDSTLNNYTRITGGSTLVADVGATGGNADDDASYSMDIGFPFYYNGVSFTEAWVNSNGYVKLGDKYNNPYASYALNAGFAANYDPNVIAAFANDLMGKGATTPTSEIRYETQGFAPNRVCIIQFQNFSIYSNSAIIAAGETYNFQIKLYENGGNGYPQVCYGTSTSGIVSRPTQVGISSATGIIPGSPSTVTDFNIRQGSWIGSTAWATNTTASGQNYGTSIMPDSGLTYTWTTTPTLQYIDSFSTKGLSIVTEPGATDQAVVAAVIQSYGNATPREITQLKFKTTGTTNVNDILSAKVYYGTRVDFSLSNTVPYGTAVFSPNGTMTFTGSQLLAPGPNYFWLAYDVSFGASNGSVIDAMCVSAVDSATYTILPNDSAPAGSRLIVPSLHGNYTIDAAGSGPFNFASFQTALDTLYTYGISGKVVFTVAAGTYNRTTPLNINSIYGTSSANTITFQGIDKATTIFTGSLASNPIIRINGASFIKIRNLTITNTASGSCAGIVILASQSSNMGSNCHINNCIISLPNSGTSISTSIALTSDASGLTFPTSIIADSLVVDSNVINRAYQGVGMQGALNGTLNKGFKINNNIFTNMYFYGVRLNYMNCQFELMNNEITNLDNGVGVYLNYSAGGILAINNKISGFGTYGIQQTNAGAALNNVSRYVNNLIVGTSATINCLSATLGDPSPLEIYHNTLIYKGAGSTVAQGALYVSGNPSTFNAQIKNNIFYNKSNGTLAPAMYLGSSPPNGYINYNTYYNDNPANTSLVFRGATTYTPSTYLSAGAGGDSSFNALPPFNSEYKLMNGCSPRSALDLSYIIPTDLAGVTRSTTPHLGVYEGTSVGNDLGIEKLITPMSPITPGASDVVFRVKNYGNTPVYSFNFGYIHNNATPVTSFVIQTLNSCDTTTVAFTTPQQINLIGANALSVYTYSPNSFADGDANNDTLKANFFGPLKGVFAVGGINPDFATVVDAANALVQSGVSGPVTFNVAPGTYTGQVKLSGGTIPGMADSTPIAFIGANAATTIITANITQQAAVFLDKISYVTFRNLTINNTNAGNPIGVAIVGTTTGKEGTGCKIKNCIIDVGIQTTTSYGIIVTSTANGYGIANTLVDSVEIDSNVVMKGYYGIILRGNQNAANNFMNKVRGNTVSAYLYGMYVYYIYNTVDVMNNTINMSPAYPATGTNYGLYFYYNQNTTAGTNGHKVTGNRIYNTTYYGMYLYYFSSPAASPAIFANNLVIGGKYSTSTGMYIYSAAPTANVKVYHNTVLMNIDGSTTTNGIHFYNTTGTVQEIKNNLLKINTQYGGTAYPLYCQNNLAALSVDNNIYYNNTSNQVIYRGGIYTTANYKTATAGGANSLYNNAGFSNLNDGVLASGCLRGANLTADVPTDLYGTTRSTSPNIGAYEFNTLALDASVDAITTILPIVTGSQNLGVRIKNNGSSTITSLSINYVLNSGTPVNQTWTGSLAGCDTVTVIFTGAKQINLTAGVNSLKVYSTSPNSGTDGNMANDTGNVNLRQPLAGTYVIGAAPSDYLTFTAAAYDINNYGVSAPVVFDVKAATYTESVRIGIVAGASAANTITFKSQNNTATSVVLNYSALGASDNFVISLAGSYIKLKYMTISALNTVNGRAIEILGAASYDTISNCNINAPNIAATGNALAGIYGIGLSGVSNAIQNNIISNGAFGIYLSGVSTVIRMVDLAIDNNTIQNVYYQSTYLWYTDNMKVRNNIVNGHATYTGHYGLYIYYPYNALKVTGNVVTIPVGGYGIQMYYNTGTSILRGLVANNVIRIGGTTTATGLSCNYIQYQDVVNNTVNITSTLASSAAGYFYNSSATYNYNNVVNNIFNNAGLGYAVYQYDPALGGNNVYNYNQVHTNGANLFYVAATALTYSTLTAWRALTVHDKNSFDSRIPFISATNLGINLTDTAAWNLNGAGIQLTGNSTDISNNTRSTTLIGGAPDLGAYEFTPTALAPMATAVPVNATAGSTQAFLYGGDTIARIDWSPFYLPPTSIVARKYTGVYPTGINGNNNNSLNEYWDFDVPAGFYGYDITLFYSEPMLGSIPAEANMIGAKKSGSNPWSIYTTGSTVNTTTNTLLITGLNDFSMFTGTTSANPVPVKLTEFKANVAGNGVIVSWATASERSSSHFNIEASTDGSNFKVVGKMDAKGNSSTASRYSFVHQNAQREMNGANTIYYRLVSVDMDRSSVASNAVTVNFNTNRRGLEATNLYPNPFASAVTLSVPAVENGVMNVEVSNIQGLAVSSFNLNVEKGINDITLNQLDELSKGVYFVKVTLLGESTVIKVIKN